MYIGAAKKAAYVFAATAILMLILSMTGVDKKSTIKTLGRVVLALAYGRYHIIYNRTCKTQQGEAHEIVYSLSTTTFSTGLAVISL